MKFEKVFNNKKYVRKIESMGEGLVLFEISVDVYKRQSMRQNRR